MSQAGVTRGPKGGFDLFCSFSLYYPDWDDIITKKPSLWWSLVFTSCSSRAVILFICCCFSTVVVELKFITNEPMLFICEPLLFGICSCTEPLVTQRHLQHGCHWRLNTTLCSMCCNNMERELEWRARGDEAPTNTPRFSTECQPRREFVSTKLLSVHNGFFLRLLVVTYKFNDNFCIIHE